MFTDLFPIKGHWYTFKEDNCVQIVVVPFWKWEFSIRKEFASRGSKFFPFREDLFSEAGKSAWSKAKGSQMQSTPVIPTLDTTTKFVILTIRLARKPSLKRWQLIKNYAVTLLFSISSNICFGYSLESPHRGFLTNIQNIWFIKKLN